MKFRTKLYYTNCFEALLPVRLCFDHANAASQG